MGRARPGGVRLGRARRRRRRRDFSSRVIPYYSLAPLNAILNTAAALLLVAGLYFIRHKRPRAHRACMLSAVAVSAAFLASYLVYHYHVGNVPFMGRGWVRPVYFAILVPHVILAGAIAPLALVTLRYALRGRFHAHRRIARWTWPIWMFVSVTGVLVYLLLYQLYPPSLPLRRPPANPAARSREPPRPGGGMAAALLTRGVGGILSHLIRPAEPVRALWGPPGSGLSVEARPPPESRVKDVKQKLQEELRAAMKRGDRARTMVLRGVLAEISRYEVETDVRREAGEDAIIQILKRARARCVEALEFAEKGARQDLVQQNEAEIKVLDSYLPAVLGPEPVNAAIAEELAAGASRMGPIMKALRVRFGARLDGKTASELVKQALAKKA